jgi:hypothetical protein
MKDSLIALLAACTNPIFYGYWNESFRNEFAEINKIIWKKICSENLR